MQIHHIPKPRQNLQLQAGLRSASAVWWVLVSGNWEHIHSTFKDVARVYSLLSTFKDRSLFAAQWFLLLNSQRALACVGGSTLDSKVEVLCTRSVSRSTSILYSPYTVKDILNTFRKGMLLLHCTVGALDYNREFPVHWSLQTVMPFAVAGRALHRSKYAMHLGKLLSSSFSLPLYLSLSLAQWIQGKMAMSAME